MDHGSHRRDVMNVSHRIGTAEVESALVPYCRSQKYVGVPHPVEGEGIHAYITVKEGTVIDTPHLRDRLFGARSRESITRPSPRPDVIHFRQRVAENAAVKS